MNVMASRTLKFACIPTQYAPKRKYIGFALPKFRNKMGEFTDPDVVSWANNLYQDKVFPTRAAFNEAYDARQTYILFRQDKPMVLTKEDIENFELEFSEGAFDESRPAVQKLILKMKAVIEAGEKTIFVY